MNRRVDQKLHLAKLALAAIGTNHATETALAEAVLFHLHVAYCAYLREILQHFKLTGTADNAQQVAELLRVQQLHSADIDELVKLEQGSEWLAQMRAAYATATNIDMVPVPDASAAITLCDVTTQSDASTCSEWLRQFHALLQRQRAHAQEW